MARKWGVPDDGFSAFCGNGGPKRIGGRIGQSPLTSGWACGASPARPAVRKKRTGQPKPWTARWNFGRRATARPPDGLILTPSLAPLACWWARMIVELMIKYSKSGSSSSVSNMRSQTYLALHRLKTPEHIIPFAEHLGRSRHCGLSNRRSSRRIHCVSLRTSRSMTVKASS